MSTTILLQFVAVKMLPLSDFVTFQFTAPVFAMIATTCVMRYVFCNTFSCGDVDCKLVFNIPSICMADLWVTLIFCCQVKHSTCIWKKVSCYQSKISPVLFSFRSRVPLIGFLFILVIFLGDCLVSQPSFMFGTTTDTSAYQDTYAIGTVLTFVVAVGSGCYRVLQATSKLVPTWEFMFIGGLTSLAIGFLCPVMGLPSNLLNWTYFVVNFWKLLAISAASLSSALLLLIAVKTTGKILSTLLINSKDLTQTCLYLFR